MKKIVSILPALLLSATFQAEAADPVDFATQIEPILAERCYSCHGPDQQKHDLRLDSPDAILQGAGGHEIITPGNAEESELVKMITLPADDPDRMPNEGDPLTEEQIDLITAWIDQGAEFAPDPETLEEVNFAAHVRPILSRSCYECHGPDKQEGSLRLDRKETITEGEYTLVAGSPIDSDLHFRVTLPADDPDVMPPEGDGEPLSEKEQMLIERWIEEGADFGDWTVDQEVLLAEEARKQALPEVAEAAEKDLEMLRQNGALAMAVARDTNLITVDFRANADNIGDSHLDYLQPVSEQVMWLNLANTKITDAGLAKIAEFPNLRRLHLEHTAVTDKGLAHLTGLGELRYLNLYGTEVSNIGLIHLAALEKLQKLFLWQTQVTQSGIDAITQARPELTANIGWENEKPEEGEEAGEEVAMADVEENAEPEQPDEPAEPAEEQEGEAESEENDEAEEQASADPINETCPVSGEPIDPARTVTHEGQVIAFCCGDCKAKFEADPAQFIEKVEGFKAPKEEEEAAPEEQASAGPINDQCPMSGEPVNGEVTFTFQDQVIGFCCNNCKDKFAAAPEEHIGKVDGFEESS